eukprot:TRINITY_DN5248_c0_g1_i2.p1 TRINITY_DN5248_c0_g1~~TRINITY_DN5248_c0_g1_i2.p1  ORF type:complete len:439 (-),score=37.01 TRINITY_DN5248_c0_g1_i2:7-1278(-)
MKQQPMSLDKSFCEEVWNWLVSLQLVDFYTTFLASGYDRLSVIADISTDQELMQIGITQPGHLRIFAKEIRKLNDVISEGKEVMAPLRIEHKLGEGTFSVVHKGTWKGAAVAVKILKSNLVEQNFISDFLREFRLLQRASQHINVVHCLGINADASLPPSIIFEFLPLGSVLDCLKGGPGLLPSELLHISRGLASGVAYLHSQNIVHRDIAARNVFLFTDTLGRVSAKIGDLGMARIVSGVGEGWTQSALFPVKWTSPEAFNGRYTFQSDVWSFAVTLTEMAYGGDPYPDIRNDPISRGELAAQIKNFGRHPEIQTCPAWAPLLDIGLASLLAECWAFDSTSRPTMVSIEKLLSEMEATHQSENYTTMKPRRASFIYEKELHCMHSMGFENESLNKTLLLEHAGDVADSIRDIFSGRREFWRK